jgi:hypothetical protein
MQVLRGDVHIQVATQNFKVTFWVGGCTVVLWRFYSGNMNIFQNYNAICRIYIKNNRQYLLK